MADVLASINTRATPQGRKARVDQVKNSAGGFVFGIDDKTRLHRFLTLGTDGNTYYTKAAELTRQNADVVFRMATSDHDTLVNEILAISEAGRAPKNKQAIFALAIAASTDSPDKNRKALAIMHKVCRTGTHVFEFNKYVEQFRGRGPALNKAVANWYLKKPVDRLAYQVTKYRAREDWTHRDLLRLTKPGQYGPKSEARNALFDFITKGTLPEMYPADSLAIVEDYLAAKEATTAAQWAEIVHRGHGLSWEMLPDEALKSPQVWEALLEQGVPQTALMRQLPRLTNVFGTNGTWARAVGDQLRDGERLVKSRVHPINVLLAHRTYARGRGFRGQQTWTPNRMILEALDAAFYAAYGAIEPTGKRMLLALDVSGSMGATIGDMPITCREASAALALVTANVEDDFTVVGFTGGYGGGYGYSRNQTRMLRGPIDDLSASFTKGRRLDDVTSDIANLPFGSTDCALPAIWAGQTNQDFDGIVIMTDNETWAGQIAHPFQALTQYRNKVGHDVKQVVVGMTATGFSIADPKDSSSLDVAGFDSAVPSLISDFVADRL